MVLDARTAKVMGATLSLADIMDKYDIAMLESLSKVRQPVPDIPALYFVEPTLESIAAIVADFSDAKRGPMYKAALLCFTRSISPEAAALIKSCPALRMRVLCVVEVQLDYLPVETNIVTLGIDNPLNIYRLKDQHFATELQTITSRLVTLFVSSNERPYIRAAASSVALASRIGVAVSSAMDEYRERNPTFWYWGDTTLVDVKNGPHGDARRRSTLLIVDRSTDVLASVLHEFTYQAMLHDLVGHTHSEDKGRTMMYEDGKGVNRTLRVSNLGEQEDVFWERSKALHISEVSKYLHRALESYAASNVMAVAQRKGGSTAGRAMSNKELAKVMQQMPEFKETWAKHSGHTHFALLLTKLFNDLHLRDVSNVEQIIVTGVDEDGKKIKYKDEWRLFLQTVKELVQRIQEGRGSNVDDDNDDDDDLGGSEPPWKGMGAKKDQSGTDGKCAVDDDDAGAGSKESLLYCDVVRLMVTFCAVHGGFERCEWKDLKRVVNNECLMENVSQNLMSFGLTSCCSARTTTKRNTSEVAQRSKEAKANTKITRKRDPMLMTMLRLMIGNSNNGNSSNGNNSNNNGNRMIDMDTCAPWVNKEDQPAAAQNNRSRIPRSTRKPYKARNWYTAEKDDDSSSSNSTQEDSVAPPRFSTRFCGFLPRIYVFIPDASYSEVRAINDTMAEFGREIILISSGMTTSLDFARYLSTISTNNNNV